MMNDIFLTAKTGEGLTQEEIKNALIQTLDNSGVEYSINGDQEFCVSSTLNLCIKGVSSEALRSPLAPLGHRTEAGGRERTRTFPHGLG